ncbi:MAG: hypothetical protein ACTSXU_09825 [Promethearchaeota archaeon]
MKKQVLNLLYNDSFQNLDEIAQDLGISRQVVTRNVLAIEKNDYLRYTVIINPNLLNTRLFFIEIKTNPEEPEIISRLLSIPGIETIDGIIGQNSLIAKFQVWNNSLFHETIEKIDNVIANTRFQYYRIIDCLRTFKIGGKPVANNSIAHSKLPVKIDDLERRIIEIILDLKKKFTFNHIHSRLKADGMDVSYAKVRRRINHLINSGAISSFTIKIRPHFISTTDLPLKFYVQIIPKSINSSKSLIKNILMENINVTDIYRTGQQYSILAIVRTSNVQSYRIFIENLYESGQVQDSISTLVIDEKMPSIFKPFN